MNNGVKDMVVMTNLVLMTEGLKNNFKLSPELMNEVRSLEDTCHKLSQASDLTNINEALETMLKAMEREP